MGGKSSRGAEAGRYRIKSSIQLLREEDIAASSLFDAHIYEQNYETIQKISAHYMKFDFPEK